MRRRSAARGFFTLALAAAGCRPAPLAPPAASQTAAAPALSPAEKERVRAFWETFRQARLCGRYNVVLYRRYRAHGMPRLGPLPGLARWAKLLLTTPLVATRLGRARWLWQAGWRLGRLEGCLRCRVLAL